MFFNILIIILFVLAAFSRKRYTMIFYPMSVLLLLIKFFGVSSSVLVYFLVLSLACFVLLLSMFEFCFPTSEIRFKRFSYTPYVLFTAIVLGVFAVNIYHVKNNGALINLVNNFNVDTHVDWQVLLKFV